MQQQLWAASLWYNLVQTLVLILHLVRKRARLLRQLSGAQMRRRLCELRAQLLVLKVLQSRSTRL